MAFFLGKFLFWVFFPKGLGCLVPLKAVPSLMQGELCGAERPWGAPILQEYENCTKNMGCGNLRGPQAAPGQAGEVLGGSWSRASRALPPAKATQGFCFAM